MDLPSKSADIRQSFLKYFESQGHEIVSSSSLVPGTDPTLLFTNAGMVQFKDLFLGNEKRSYVRATSSQRCVRAGGKHNDLENVGYTARHHTFFEMLGNFSFGDYFKKDAIFFAWTFLTVNLGLPKEKLWITVFETDTEAEDIWLNDIGIDPERLSRLGEKDNFWAMGDTGPCGPCSEIFYDHGADIPGGPPGSPEEDGDRYIEIWNLVFMQFNRNADGDLSDLPKPSVDTGMGLERISAIMQGVHNNYEIDLFQPLLQAAAELTNTKDIYHTSLKVIADHIRSCSFLIVDDVLPSNEGRGYVLRRIIRRAIRHGHQLGTTGFFFHKLVAPLAEVMGSAYPEMLAAKEKVERVLLAEEEQFSRTLENGMSILEESIQGLKGKKEIPGETVFKLYDTYGFPVDLTADIAREKSLTLDMSGFNQAMQAQKKLARSASRFESVKTLNISLKDDTEFVGYNLLENDSEVVGIYLDGDETASIKQGDKAVIILNSTSFYGESGGQVGDTGLISNQSMTFEVNDTQLQNGQFLHYGTVMKGTLKTSEKVHTQVDSSLRQAIILNHSATHLLHAALKEHLGEHVNQKGSLVNASSLRFDFSHNSAISLEQVQEIEDSVNHQVLLNSEVSKQTLAIDEAKKLGAMALFGEKYGDEVRVVSMGSLDKAQGPFSIELCGGTHVTRTGDIGFFKILHESGIAAGVRRIEAVTGKGAFAKVRLDESKINNIAELLKSGTDVVVNKVEQLTSSNKALEKELLQLKAKLASTTGSDLAGQAESVKDIKLVSAVIEGVDPKSLRETADQLKNKLVSGIVVLGTVKDGKVSLVAAVTKDVTDRIKAGDLVNMVAKQVGGKGGGRPDMAMAGGTEPENLEKALISVKPYIERIL